jgi:preprotein translocase subunit Sec63
MPASEQAAHTQNEIQLQKLVDRQYMVAHNQAGIDDRTAKINQWQTAIRNLPDDSDLQTLQLMAQQQNYMLQQQEIQIGRMNQILSSQETFSEFAATQDAAAKDRAAAQEAKHRTNNLPSTLGTNIWKTF